MTSNDDIIRAWREGKRGTGKHIKTDGINLFSYALLIATTGEMGEKIAYDYTGRNFISITTSHHVGKAKFVSDFVKEPEV